MMKKQPPAKGGSMDDDEDRISQLPVAILHHHILSLLSQKDAVRTCILSKSWRYLGSTRPKFEFDEGYYPGNSKQQYVSVVKNTLQRYVDQNLPIQEFILRMSRKNSESISFLKEWIPIVLKKKLGVKTFKLMAYNYTLPSVVFQAEFLTELYLSCCELGRINNRINVKLQMLKCLSLLHVDIEEETFEKIVSSCPLIEHLVLSSCNKLWTIRVNKARNLKHFECDTIDRVEINDDTPSLETVCIVGHYECWYHLHNNYLFPHLKSLNLYHVHLPTELLNNLSSNNCPCLEDLELRYCFGFREFKLSSRSIKRLVLSTHQKQKKAAIDAANMLYFKYTSEYFPTISFATISSEWKSHIEVWRSETKVLSTWLLDLYEFLNTLSQSEIYLDTSFFFFPNRDTYNYDDGGSCEPVVVERLLLRADYSFFALPALLNPLFRICRPRYIGVSLQPNPKKIFERELAESIWETLTKNKGETRECDFWHQDLEESYIQVLDENALVWRSVQECEFSNNEEIQFKLKWRDSSYLA